MITENNSWIENGNLRMLACCKQTDAKTLDELAKHGDSDIRSCVALNENTSKETLLKLLNDPDRVVRYEANRNPTHKEWLIRQRFLS
ncbi:hypothetical protein RCS94_06605 [Orbaceae bacterium ac157xtp]